MEKLKSSRNSPMKNISRKYSDTFIEPKINLEKDDEEEEVEFELIYQTLLEGYKRKKYRKVFEFIDKREKYLKQLNIANKLFFSHMKMNCILKIIDKKFNKYYATNKLKGIEKWFRFADILLNKFSSLISKLYKIEIKEQCEYVILYFIKIYYYHSLYSKFKNDIKEYISYLIMAEELIKNVIDKITFPETFIFIIRIFLLLSNLLIKENCIFSSINYLLSILQIIQAIKKNEIILQNKNNILKEKIFITNKDNVIDKDFDIILTEINFLSAITFILLGVCFENLNDFFLSNSAYRQAKWITENLLNENKYLNLLTLLEDLVDKSNKEKNIIMILCNLDMIKFINKYKKKPKKKVLDCYQNKKLIQYKRIEKKLEKLKLKESNQLQDILLTDNNEKKEKSKNIKLMTNNVILLNYLSSEQFKPVIYKMKNMNFYNMNKETELLISKRLELIKNKKNQKTKKYKSLESINYSKMNISEKIKKVRSGKRFQTEFKDKIKLINLKKDNIFEKSKKNSIKDLLFRKDKLKLSVKNIRKITFDFEKEEKIKSKNESLNESSFLDKTSSNNHFSFSNKKSNELSQKSINKAKTIFSPISKNKNKDQGTKIVNDKSINKIKKTKKNKVPKPMKNNNKLDKYIFSKIYIKKLEHIEKLTNKEYKFQKGILRNKSYEQFPEVKYEPEKDKKDAELLFIKTLDEKLKLLEEKVQIMGNNNKKDDYLEKKMKRQILSLKNKACISLNYKDKENYFKSLKDDINNNNNEKEEKNKKIEFFRCNSEFDIKRINENNNIQMNILGGKIEKVEKKIIKNNYKIKNKEKTKKKRIINLDVKNKEINIIHPMKSSKEINKKAFLFEEFIANNRLSLKIDKDFISKMRNNGFI